MEDLLTWLSYWTTDSVITGWAKAHVIFTGVLIVAARTIANRTKMAETDPAGTQVYQEG